MNTDDLFDRLSEKPLWVVDPMPARVPADKGAHWFALEDIWHGGPERARFFARLGRILQKLNCYYDFLVQDGEETYENPAPAALAARVERLAQSDGDWLNIFLDGGSALVAMRGDELTMAVYNPDEKSRALLEKLAAGEGLFFWRSE